MRRRKNYDSGICVDKGRGSVSLVVQAGCLPYSDSRSFIHTFKWLCMNDLKYSPGWSLVLWIWVFFWKLRVEWTRKELGQSSFPETELLLVFWIFDVLTWCSQRALFPSILVILEMWYSEAQYQHCRRNNLVLRIHLLVYTPTHPPSSWVVSNWWWSVWRNSSRERPSTGASLELSRWYSCVAWAET